MTTRTTGLLAALLLSLATVPAAAQTVPKTLHLQGALTDADGAPASGEWIVTVRLFDVEGGQIPFHEETLTVEPVNGVFGVTLGTNPGDPLPVEDFEDGEVWVAFVVSGGDGPQELSPRLRVTSTPYSLRAGAAAAAGQADNALSLGGVGAGSYVTLSQLPDLCVTSEGLPGALDDLGYTPGAGYSDADVLAFLGENGYSPCACYGDAEVQIYLDLVGYTPGAGYSDADAQAWLDLQGYVPGPHYGDADVQAWLDLMGYTPGLGYSDGDVAAWLEEQGYPGPEATLLVDGSRPLAGDWDVAGRQLLNLVVHNAASDAAPAAPNPGQLWFDTTTSQLKFYTGAAWLSVGTGSVAGDLTCEGCVDPGDVSFDWALADAPGGAALSAKSLTCDGCVVASHLTVPYAASVSKAGPAADLACDSCVDETEAAFSWAAAVAPGGVALAALEAVNADTVDGVHSVDFEPAGAMAAHAATPHLSEAEHQALTDGGETALHTHVSTGAVAAPPRVRMARDGVNLPPGGTTRERVHVFSAVAPKVYLYVYGETYSNMVLANHTHGSHNHTFSNSYAAYNPASYRCGADYCNGTQTITVNTQVVGTGSYPLTAVTASATPKGVQIWVDDADRTAAIGDQQGVGAPGWTGTGWGSGAPWETGRLDLSNVMDWGVGEHVIEFKETGNAGGRLSYNLYVVHPAGASQPLANDTCAGAQALEFTGGVAVVKSTTEDMLGETKAQDDLAPAACGGTGGGDVVYAATITERITIHAAVAAPFATRLYVLDAPCGDQVVLACGTTDVTTPELDPGTYYVVVDADASGETGDFTLTVELEASPLPANDTCATAAAIAAGPVPVVVNGTTQWGLDQTSGTCGGDGAADVVYSFEATDVNDDLVATINAPFASVLVLRAQSCEAGFQLSCSTNGALNIPGLAPGVYYLHVDGASAVDEGDFALSVTLN
ncbi:MAG: hypothetical protein ABIK09_05505 [Pseudomonadota bacterium]